MYLPAVLVANIFGVLLAIVLFSKKANSFDIRNKELKITSYMLIIASVSCVLDCLACVIEAKSGSIVFFIVYVVNLWLYLSNVIFGSLWVMLVATYFKGGLSKLQKALLLLLGAITFVFVVINFFKPVLFYVDSLNIYHRLDLYIIFVVMDFVLIIEGVVDYIISKIKGGRFVFFPIWQFILPVVIGIVIQNSYYGVTTIWPCVIISLCSVKLNFQAEASYKDRLTGLYNRYYLDIIYKNLKSDSKYTVIMLDLNSFKQINDKYGHQQGDKAIYELAIMLKEVMGSMGFVIRFAGDEFIVVLNTAKEDVVRDCFKLLNQSLDEYNQKKVLEYELSYSYGYCINNGEGIPLQKMLGVADKMMYENKREFYRNNKGFNRRER